jgi:nicotinamidase-related amidase
MGRLIAPIGSKAAHLCVDMQNLFAPGRPWATPWMPRVLPAIELMVKRCPECTVFTRFIPPPSAETARGIWKIYYQKWACVTGDQLASECLDIVPALAKYMPPAVMFDRMGYSAFGGDRLHEYLQAHSVETLIISGGETDVCVLASVLSAIDYGYRVVIVEDALCSSSDQSHDNMLSLFSSRFDIQIEVGSAQQILDRWHPCSY